MKISKFIKTGLLLCLLGITSCASIKDPKNIPVQLDYTNEDVISNEIARIKSFEETEPVKALWRAILLGNEKIIEETQNLVEVKLDQAIEEKDYFAARKYFISLNSLGYEFDDEKKSCVEELVFQDIPGLSEENTLAPSSIKDCMNATVTIWVDKGVKVENGAGFADIVIGSGFFIDSKGYIVTNHHVIESMVDPKYEGYSRLYIKLLSNSDDKIPAKVVGYDSVLDLALLKVEINPEFVLSLGSSSDLNIGDKISAIGTPLGLEGTLTSGIISSVDRKLMTFGNVFQIDAAVNSGNSGGPLIDSEMKVQAVVFAGMLRNQGLNFAIPVEYLKQELPMLYNSGVGGELIHPWIGCYGHTKRNGNKKVGLEIQYVTPGSSASFSGLKVGDVIYEVNGEPIETIEDLQFLYMGYQTETLLKCKYYNDAQEPKECYIYLEARSKNPFLQISNSDFVYNTFVPAFGMRLIHSSTTNRNVFKIQEVIKGTIADQMSFSENDTIQIREVKFDNENGFYYALINTERQKKGRIDIIMTLATTYDSPYYF